MCPIAEIQIIYENHLRDMGHYFIAGSDVTLILPLYGAWKKYMTLTSERRGDFLLVVNCIGGVWF